jgi:alpha-L-arabinofuranosidase
MKRNKTLPLIATTATLLGAATICAVTSRAQDAPNSATAKATLTVDAGVPGIKTSPLLYGIFFEEINHAGDGGLYAELVRNRGLEDKADAPQGWTLASGGGEGSVGLGSEQPLNAATPHSLRLEITKGGAGAANDGYWGVPVKDGETYRFNFYARRSAEADTNLTVRLESADGQKVYAETRVAGVETGWKRFAGTLKAKGVDTNARLVLRSAKTGTLWFDVVSLFPSTWKGRENGLRPDLARMVAEMKPTFVRFPGGCFVEGDTLQNAFRWKETIGDIAERPGRANLWGYRSTDGLGYHEYLQFCEDLGAEPLFVFNCGMSHKGVVPLDQLEPWIQEALDAVEYANGPVTSKWGALRAKHGHPKPFNLKYVEIGNENGGAAYDERYARFYDAFKKRYPDVKLIANVWGGVPKSRPLEILDEHGYHTPDYFVSRAYQHDSYDRKGPKIYVGEFAATSGGIGEGNLKAALGEAAYMTGLERNSDVVIMSSYAPLFVHTKDRKWNPDAIVFDNAKAYGTPSYYVQQLFRQNQGETVLPATVESVAEVAAPRGAVGVATWQTDAEFKEVKVTRGSDTLLDASLATEAPGWRTVRGDWKIAEGAYRQSSRETDQRAIAGDPNWSGDMTYTLKARKRAGAEGFLIMFRVRDDNNWIWWNIGGWGNTRHVLEKAVGGAKSELGSAVNGKIDDNRWYDIRIETQGNRIRCYLDGKLIHDVVDQGPKPLSVVAGRADKGKTLVLKVVNYSAKAQETTIDLRGAGKLAEKGEAIVLTSDKPSDENSLMMPQKVTPVRRTVSGIGERFTHTFAPYSVTILRLKSEK